VPDALAAGILTIESSSDFTALRYPASGPATYKVVFMATPLEALKPGQASPSYPETYLKNCLDWLTGAPDTTPPDAITDLSITRGGASNIMLSWSAPWDNLGVDHYNVYRDTVAYVDPSPGSHAATVALTVWTDVDAAGDPDSAYFYVVTAVDAADNESTASNRVGVTGYGTEASFLSSDQAPGPAIGSQPQRPLHRRSTHGALFWK
jgi:hypothetical protein